MQLLTFHHLDQAQAFIGTSYSTTAGIYGSPKWWHAVELMRPEVEVLYFGIDFGENGRAAAPVYLYPKGRSSEPYAPDWLTPGDEWPSNAAMDRWALFGGCSGLLSGLTYRGNVNPYSAYALLLEYAVSQLQREDYHVLSKFFGSNERSAISNVFGLSEDVLPLVDINAAIEPLPTTIDSFVEQLPSRSRGTVRRDLRYFENSEITINCEKLADVLDELPFLWDNVETNHGANPNLELRRDMLVAQSQALNDCSVVYTCRDSDGRAVAMSLNYRMHGTSSCRLVGIDYDAARSSRSYFQCMYYSPIVDNTSGEITTLYLGPAALGAKVIRGAKLLPRYSVFFGLHGEMLSKEAALLINRQVSRTAKEQICDVSSKVFTPPSFLNV